jgi:hypothetical protein
VDSRRPGFILRWPSVPSMRLPSSLLAVAMLASFAGLGSAQVAMTQLAEFDVAAVGIGPGLGAVAWNGTDLVVAGFNTGSTMQTVALARCSNALTAPQWNAPFGAQAGTNTQRGFANLAFSANGQQLAVGYDNGAAPVATAALQLWSSGTLLWAKPGRGSSGVGFDPGFAGQGSGVAWARFGTTGRALQQTSSGADVWTFVDGMPLNVVGQGTFFRDLDFDPLTGDVYLRASNNVFVGVRTGGNACTPLVLVDTVDADTVPMQNIAVLRAATGAAILWNDRTSAAAGQAWTTSIRASRLDGTPQAIDWGTFTSSTGTGAYDFSFHAGSNTVAIADFANRKVHLFAVSVPPFYGYGSGCAGASVVAPTLTATSTLQPGVGGTFAWQLGNLPSFSVGVLVLGFAPLNVPLIGSCSTLVDPAAYVGPFVVGPLWSTVSVPWQVPPGFPGVEIYSQAGLFVNGTVDLGMLAVSNGLKLVVP